MSSGKRMEISWERIAIWVLGLAILWQALPPLALWLLYPTDLNSNFQQDTWIHLQKNTNNNGMQRNVLVTGANSGLGWGTVYHLAQLPNLHIVLACRSMERCVEAKQALSHQQHVTTKLSCAPLDLGQRSSIEALVYEHLPNIFAPMDDKSSDNSTMTNTTTKSTFPLHYLINNAGIWSREDHDAYTTRLHRWHHDDNDNNNDDSPLVEMHMAVNHLGHVLLTHFLWPHLRQTARQADATTNGQQQQQQLARVVTVSSMIATLPIDPLKGWFPVPPDNDSTTVASSSSSSWHSMKRFFENIRLYAATKHANLHWAAELHDRWGLEVVSVASHPGYTRTNILQSGGSFLPKILRQALIQNTVGSMSTIEGAWTQVRAAVDEQGIPGGMLVGPSYGVCGKAVPVGRLRDQWWMTHFWPFSKESSQKLWDQSLEVLGIVEFGNPQA